MGKWNGQTGMRPQEGGVVLGIFDDLGDNELLVALRGCVAEGIGGREWLAGFIGIKHVDKIKGVGGGLDVFGVDGVQFIHVAEYVLKLCCIGGLFLIGQLQPGKFGHVVDIQIV